jgi:hypothetical protein
LLHGNSKVTGGGIVDLRWLNAELPGANLTLGEETKVDPGGVGTWV